MSDKNNIVCSFENKRWSKFKQKVEYRHEASLKLIPDGVNSLLDVGCGEGTFLSLLHARYPKLVLSGVDLSEVALRKAKSKDHVKYSLIDNANSLHFNNATFDVVTALDVLEHTLEPDQILSEMTRVSKKYLIISVPNFSSFPARLQMLRGIIPENNKPNKGHMFWFNRNVLYKMIEKHNLKIVKEFSNNQLQNNFLLKLLKNTFPSLFALSYVVLVEKNNT